MKKKGRGNQGVSRRAAPPRTEETPPSRQVLVAKEPWRRGTLVLGRILVGSATVLGIVSGLIVLRSDVSIDPDISLSPPNPFATYFRFQNRSPFSINDVDTACLVMEAYAPEIQLTARGDYVYDPTPSISLNVGESVSRPCLFFSKSRLHFTEANVIMKTTYRPVGWPFRRATLERFVGVIDGSGIVRWTHQPLGKL